MCLYFSPHRQNDYGQIGIGSNENVTVPRFVECLVHVSKVTCGANHNLALTVTEMHCAMQLYITFNIFSSLDKQLKFLIVHMLCIPYTTSLVSLMCSHIQEVNPISDLSPIMV